MAGRKVDAKNEDVPERHLAHERGAGAPCLKCGPACDGLDLHFWRKICKVCYCKYEDHDVKQEEEIHHDIVRNIFRKERGLEENIGKLEIADLKNEPVIGENVKANFIQVPEVSSAAVMAKYLDAIPKDKAAHHDEAGAQYRSKQLAKQLPAHDFDEAFCDNLTDAEREKMKNFNERRNEEAAGQGEIKEKTPQEVTQWVCERCNKHLLSGEVAIFAERAGKDKCWHPGCFVCSTCTEMLVDLIYFYKDDKIYCGRHYGELTRVRCAACDELIFTKEYTQAENQNWHIKHFCCFNCDTALGGHKYVAREEKPYCMKCYDQLFAKVCAACRQKIPADGKRVSYKESHWHATEDCFKCVTCKTPMLGHQFIYKDSSVFCTPACAKKR
ncbi:testin-like isoform X2 [Hydractinia symbiolongicarpus]|uniref:testin-like isoform X2 n=1 Tax=Hydractinia symbiolongicarpus TaxID=13093 RepID=UPI00254C29EB|nr:testin-like isoform X2 [Hydractinia symbiolongicarpus]